MKGNRAVLAAVVAVVLIAGGWWLFRKGSGAPSVDLIEQLPSAQRTPAERTFNVTDVNLNGESHKAIEAEPASRIIWKVRIPEDAWLRVNVGLKPEAWTAEGDGVLFFVGVSDGRTFDKLFEQVVNPFNHPGDRKWIPVMVDLASYAGEEVEVIFNTRNSADRKPLDPRNDFAVWGAPEIISK
ncbi:MAG: hypothetical protein H0W18_16950 [Acidobacteria bacterium]|nr:hypothetical protein [Acidobacteriota bacterium]